MLKGSETLLFVDDEELIIDVGTKMLEMLGYTVIVATSGQDAIDTYGKNSRDVELVILDMMMPDMDGGTTYDRLKELNPGVKVLLSSGYGLDGQAAEIIERGCNGFLQKPFNMEQLAMKIREVLDAGG